MNLEDVTMEYLFRVEKQAEKILVDKSEIIALDKIRNNNRMAIRALMNYKTPQDKTWMAIGPCMVKVSCEKAKTMLLEEKIARITELRFPVVLASATRQVTLDSRVNILRSDIKENVNILRDMEYKEPVKGLFLNPLTKKEMKEMNLVEDK